MESTIRVFRGLAVRTRRTLGILGLDPPEIPTVDQVGVCMWFLDDTGRINSLTDMLRPTLQMKGERVIFMVGYTILSRVYSFAPGFSFA
jgi:hypothetical protein